MRKNTNTQWFTLVELIIVITILAILATIAFISFQGYSKEARNSWKMSEVSEIVKAIALKDAKENNLSLTGTLTTGWTKTWALNKAKVWINSKNTYHVWTYKNTYYLIASELETVDNMPSSVYLTGTAIGSIKANTPYFISWNTFFDSTTGGVSINDTCIASGTTLVGRISGTTDTTYCNTNTWATVTVPLSLTDFFQ